MQEYGKYLTMALISKANDKQTNLRGAARAVGIAETVASDWIRGNTVPTDEEIQKLCDFLECSAADIKKLAETQYKKANASNTDTVTLAKTTPKQTVETKTDTPKAKEEKDFPMPKPVKETAPEAKQENASKAKESAETVKADANPPKDTKPKKTKTTALKTNVTTAKKPATPAKSNELVLPEDMDTFVRKSAGLKKSDVITKADVVGVFNNTASEVKDRLSELSRLEQSITEALYSSLADDKVEPRLEKLVATARKATDEGLDLAITILEKFAK